MSRGGVADARRVRNCGHHTTAAGVPRGLRRSPDTPANAVHDDLEIRVLVLRRRQPRVALVTCDLLAMSRDFSDPIRAAVADVVGTTADAVLTSCTHVHAGPSTLTGTDAIGWPVPDGLHDRLVRRATHAADRALRRRCLGGIAPSASTFRPTSRSIGADIRCRRQLRSWCSIRLRSSPTSASTPRSPVRAISRSRPTGSGRSGGQSKTAPACLAASCRVARVTSIRQ